MAPTAVCVVVLFLLLSSQSHAITSSDQTSLRLPESACPGVLTYDEEDTARTRWSAYIEINPEQRLEGFTLSIALDKPAEVLGNVVGEVTTSDNKHFEIKTRKKLSAGIPFFIRFFVKHSSVVPVVKTIKLNGVQICSIDEAYFQTEPRRVLARPGDTVLLLGQARTPLRYCHFYLPDKQLLDLSQGPDSTATNRYEYHGRGLASGECGLRLKQVEDENDGVIECRVKPVEKAAEWMTSVTTLRVTNLRSQDLPVFSIIPRRLTLNAGDNATLTCNADRPLNLCHFHLPDGRVLNFDLGPLSDESPDSPEFRYHGSGLQVGHCGVTLTGAYGSLNGFVVCKVGRWPDSVNGSWETDALKMKTNGGSWSSETATQGTQTGDLGFQPGEVSIVNPVYGSRTIESTSSDYPYSFPNKTTPAPASNGVVCGKTTVPASVAVTNQGQRTYRGQWPWHIALYQTTKNGSLLYTCGGSLIGGRSVVTAAHCVTKQPFDRPVDPTTLMVYLGKHRLTQWAEDGLQERQVERVVVHPTYNRTGFKSDLAVLVLRTKVNYTNYVRPICLWDAFKTDLNEVEGRDGTVVGWGIDERGQLTQELMKATMSVVSYSSCLYSKAQHFVHFTSDNTFCAGFRNGTTVCNGDSGGGMVFPTITSLGKRWFLRGLVSNSIARTREDISMLVCDPRNYIVFTDLAQFLDWLTPFAVL